jgi:hypothetical protein
MNISGFLGKKKRFLLAFLLWIDFFPLSEVCCHVFNPSLVGKKLSLQSSPGDSLPLTGHFMEFSSSDYARLDLN